MRGLRGLRLLITGVGGTLFLLGLSPAGASSANISHSYSSKVAIPDGSIVSLDPTRSDYVEPATSDNGSRLLGVAVAKNDSLLAVDSNSGKIQVATSGNATVLVSTINGDIKVGDQIAVSPFGGVGMKASSDLYVIGLAQTSFNKSSQGAGTKHVKDKKGQSKQIEIGYSRINIAVGSGSNGTGGQALNSLQKIAKSVTGRVIPTPRLIISMAVAFVAVLALLTLMYASIYGSIISIGRNPLAKFTVFRTLASVMGIALITAILATATIFLLLR